MNKNHVIMGVATVALLSASTFVFFTHTKEPFTANVSDTSTTSEEIALISEEASSSPSETVAETPTSAPTSTKPASTPTATNPKPVTTAPAPTPAPTPMPTPTPAVKPSGITMADVATHNSKESCWTVISGGVYDVTSFISKHPGGASRILALCGEDGTSAFLGQHDGDRKPEAILATMKIGDLVQ